MTLPPAVSTPEAFSPAWADKEESSAAPPAIAGDNAANADMLATLLEMTGYKVVVEYDPLKALARSIIEMPSIFILDIGLPEMNGKELARRLRAQPETQHATLIALSGYSEDQELINAKEAGFDHYFVKPLDFKKFLALLNGNPP